MNLGDLAYWELRYAKEFGEMLSFAPFDWYCPFDLLYREMLRTLYDTSKAQKVLVVGVGRSNVIECLYSLGLRDITAIDISQTAILQMQKRYEAYAGVEFMVMDVRSLLKFADETFTLIFDKACIDALFCGTDYFESSTTAIKELHRVLKYDGALMTVTHAPAIARVPYFRCCPWGIDSYKVPKFIGEGLTLFVMAKTTNEVMLDKRIPGAEAGLRPKARHVVSNMDSGRSKMATTRSGQNTGSITVSASADIIAELVAESAEMDG